MPAPGDLVVDRFEIEAEIGAGGMGAVYRALDRASGERVALKVGHDWGRDAGDRFDREARVLRELSHPGVVRHVAHGASSAGLRFLAMEWLDGEDLGRRLARGRLTVAETVALGATVADTLAAVHACGVVHRDLKPSNLFLVDERLDRAKILDFGVARLGAATRALTRTGAMMGTPSYMAPEQARGERDVDGRADLFSLGCVLYECLTGRPAFHGEHAVAVLARVIFDEAPRVADLRHDLPAALDELIFRLVAKDRAARPAAAGEVAATLRELSATGGADPEWAARAPSLTSQERRLVSVVLAAPPARGTAPPRTPPVALAVDSSPTLPATPATPVSSSGREATVPDRGPPSAVAEPVRAAAERHGAALVTLLDGSRIALLVGAGSATDLAGRAARCALAMRAAGPDLALAVATGRGLLAAAVPVGDVIDRAARALADGGGAPGVRLDPVTAGLLPPGFEVRPDARGARLEDDARPGAGDARTLLGRATPFVGRERDLAALLGIARESAAEPVARVALVTAAAGVGKSRLRHELFAVLRDEAEPPELLLAHGDPMRAGAPFGLLGAALRRAAGILDGDAIDERRRKLAARLARVPESDRPRVQAFLGELCGAPHPDEAALVELRAARRDPKLLHDQTRRAWIAFLDAELAARPVLVCLEDLHWGDVPTIRLVDAALGELHDRPLTVLLLARPEIHDQFPDLFRDRDLQELRLPRLTRRACERLVREVLGAGVAEDEVARIVERAGGNAFYLEELVRASAEGRGAGAAGAPAGSGPEYAPPTPETVLAMAQARLEALPVEARRVLRAAAVYGQTFSQDGVAALLGGEGRAAGIGEWLAVLVDREVVAPRPEARRPEDPEFGFRHGLMRDAAYLMLTDDDRVLGHRLAGAWLAERGEGEPLAIAEHFERGGEAARAVAHYARAAEQALAGQDLVAAIELGRRGIDAGAEGEVRGALRLAQARAHGLRGQTSEMERCAGEALALYAAGTPSWFEVVGLLAVAGLRRGDEERVVGLAQAVLEAFRADAPEVPRGLVQTAVPALRLGRRDLFDAILARVAPRRAELLADPATACWLHQAYAWAALYDGDVVGALRGDEASADAFERAGDRHQACIQRAGAGSERLQLGDYEGAEAIFRRTIGEATRLDLGLTALYAKLNLAQSLVERGAIAEAAPLVDELLLQTAHESDRQLEAHVRFHRVQLALLAGDLGRADREAERALELTAPRSSSRVQALSVVAKVRLQQARPADALAAAGEAMTLMGALGGMEDGESLLWLVYGRALRDNGRDADAERAFRDGGAALRGRAEKISEPALRATFLAVPENAALLAEAGGAGRS